MTTGFADFVDSDFDEEFPPFNGDLEAATLYAVTCGTISRIAYELCVRFTTHYEMHAEQFEALSTVYDKEADNSHEFWEDGVSFDTESDTVKLIDELIYLLPTVQASFTLEHEMGLAQSALDIATSPLTSKLVA